MKHVWKILERMQGDIACEIRQLLGETVISREVFNDEQRARRIEAMKQCAADDTTEEERHESWMRLHREAGWQWGPEFDAVRKLHPNMLPWNQLPEESRYKARIFCIVSKAARDLEIELLSQAN
jgi:hypothetical protein